MPAASLPANESARLKALYDLDVMDSPPEAEFDALVNVASLVCGAPYSLITLVDANRQWFKASKGMHGVSEIPRSVSFCAHAILGDDVLEVPDTTRDPRFSDNPLVTAEPHLRFYAGAPVVLSDGAHVGTLCVIDRQPRELNVNQREILKSLAVAVARALEGRKAIRTQEKIMRALHKSEMLLDRTGAMAGVGGWEVDLATGGIYWSKETRRIHGVSPDYVPVMEEAINFYAPEARPTMQAAVEEGMASGKSWDLELPFIRLDGTPIWVRAVGTVEFENNQPVRLLGAFQDITARRQVESESLRNAQLLRGSIEALDDAFALFDPQDRLVLCNQRYREIYPQSAHMMQPGNTFEDIIRAGALGGQYPEATGDVEAWIAKRMAIHLQPSSNLIQRVSNGRVLRVVERKLPDGHIVGFRVDITDLMRATEAAQEASNAKGQFLANMSHEIRTPMNAILGMLTLLRKTPLTPQQANYASKGEGATRLLLGVINDILDFSKIEAGKLTLNNQPFRTDQLLQDLQVILATSTGSKPVTVLYDIDPRLPRRLVGDALRLQQVLINLGGNAIKFTAQGEVVISITVASRTPPPEQTVTLNIAVKDTGIGIAPDNQARIFDGFSQAEASTTRRFGGTGLGVAISQRLVTLLGGKLQMSSALGQGSNFYFTLTLPFNEDVMGDDPNAALTCPMGNFPNALRLAGMRLLLVEDNLNNQQVASELLQLEGAWVQIVADGQQAIDTIAAHHTGQGALTRFDLVLMDLQMPVMDGFTATHHIRNTLGLKNLPIVAMTANAMDSDRDACLAAGMNGHVGKPIDLNHLVDVLQRLAAQSWMRPVLPVDGAQSPAQAERIEQAVPAQAEPFPVRAELVEALSCAAQAAGVDLDTTLNRLGHNLALYERALRKFVAELQGMPAQLRAHQAARDTPQATRLLHTLKGLAATLGASALAAVAGEGEKLLKSHTSGTRALQDPAFAIDTTSPDLPAVVERTCAAIMQASPGLIALHAALQVAMQANTASASAQATAAAAITDSNANTPDTPLLDTAALALALTALADKLRDFDMDAAQSMATLKHRFGAAIQAQTSHSLTPLEEAIDTLDFDLAKALCQTLDTLTKDTGP